MSDAADPQKTASQAVVAEEPKKKWDPRQNLRPFVKGQPSANPGGRPKGIRARVAALTNDGQTILKMFAEIAADPKAKPRDRIDAGKSLLDRLWGRAPETVVNIDADAESSAATREIAAEALETLARTLRSDEDEESLATHVATQHESPLGKLA